MSEPGGPESKSSFEPGWEPPEATPRDENDRVIYEAESLKGSISPEVWAAGVNVENRWGRLLKDEEVRGAAIAAVRTAINIGISVADAIPGIGELPSWAADAGKIIAPLARVFGLETDLTPDVSKKIALGSEILEAGTLTFFPSHAIETSLQLRADLPRLRRGWERVQEIWRAERAGYAANRTQLDEAMQTFGVSKPEIGV